MWDQWKSKMGSDRTEMRLDGVGGGSEWERRGWEDMLDLFVSLSNLCISFAGSLHFTPSLSHSSFT